LMLLGALSGAGPAAAGSTHAPSSEPVALVSFVSGPAKVRLGPHQSETDLKTFTWLSVGAELDVPAGSHVTLVYVSGHRYEMKGKASARIAAAGLSKRVGGITSLEPVLPRLPRLVEKAGAPAGVIRLRGPFGAIFPAAEASALADSTQLRFDPVSSAGRYTVVIEDVGTAPVFKKEVAGPPVDVPTGTLKPGQAYYWTVFTTDAMGYKHRAIANFRTLDAETANARAALHKALREAGDSASLALLAEVDRSLGLLAEAQAELKLALEKCQANDAQSSALQQALADVTRKIHGTSD